MSKKVQKSKSGVVYVGHLPHGFYEEELKAYFSQFGKVVNVRVSRSPKTGRSKGYGFVQFCNSQVAAIAAETMNNYLMFKRRLIANVVPVKKTMHIFKGKPWSTKSYPAKLKRAEEVRNQNRLDKVDTALKKLKTKLEKLTAQGIQHNVNIIDGENK